MITVRRDGDHTEKVWPSHTIRVEYDPLADTTTFVVKASRPWRED